MKKIYSLILMILTTILLIGSVNFVFATGNDRELTSDEKAAFIVRDEWTGWVRDFTASLSELDKIATAKIYDDMDFYDMQYRFTEKYKKVPEYLDEDGKPTQKLKDMIKEKRKKISGANVRDYLKFTSNQDGSTIRYSTTGTVNIQMGISTDGVSFTAWNGSAKTLNSGDSIYVLNKSGTFSTSSSNYVSFTISGNVSVSGDILSLTNFNDVSADYSFYRLFANCTSLTSAQDLKLTPTKLKTGCYRSMFVGCTGLTSAPHLPATTLAEFCYDHMFDGCSNLSNISLDYTGNFDAVSGAFTEWVQNVSSTGTIYYKGEDTTRGSSAIPTGWTVVN